MWLEDFSHWSLISGGLLVMIRLKFSLFFLGPWSFLCIKNESSKVRACLTVSRQCIILLVRNYLWQHHNTSSKWVRIFNMKPEMKYNMWSALDQLLYYKQPPMVLEVYLVQENQGGGRGREQFFFFFESSLTLLQKLGI